MSVMAKYVRIFWPEPKDEDVGRRNRAVVTIQTWISGLGDPWSAVKLASALVDGVADGTAREEFAPNVEKAIVAAGSEAFVRDGHDLEMIVVALVAALDLVRQQRSDESGWTAVDALAAGLWSALSFQTPVSEEAIELLRQEVLVAAPVEDHIARQVLKIDVEKQQVIYTVIDMPKRGPSSCASGLHLDGSAV